MISVGHNDPFDYFPLYNGLKPSSMGLLKPQNGDKGKMFQFDDKFALYRQNKLDNRGEVYKYYRSIDSKLNLELKKLAIENILVHLILEHPDKFKLVVGDHCMCLICGLTNETLVFDHDFHLQNHTSIYLDAFDALCMQVQEDITIHAVQTGTDYASTIHLNAANGWGANISIGDSLKTIHAGVPNIEKVIPDNSKMIRGIFSSKLPFFERLAAFSFRTDSVLNRHPENRFQHKPFSENPHLLFRMERQTVTPLIRDVDNGGFLFTIRTYFIDCEQISKEKQRKVLEAFKENNPNVYSSDFINNNRDLIIPWLQVLIGD